MFEHPLPGWLSWATDPEQARRVPFLSRSPLFAGLPRRLLARLATRFFEKTYHAGDVIFEEGDPGRALFVIVEGSVAITRATPKGPVVPSGSSRSSTTSRARPPLSRPPTAACSSSTRATSTRSWKATRASRWW